MKDTRGLVALRSTTGTAVIAATLLASAVATLDADVVKVAVPAIGRDLGASVSALQWTLTSYLLTVAALLLPSGALADRYGRRRLLVIGLDHRRKETHHGIPGRVRGQHSGRNSGV